MARQIGLLAFFAAILLSGACQGPDEGWAETELSRAAAAGDKEEIRAQLRFWRPVPSLYDLHHSHGALALSAKMLDEDLVTRILERAGREDAVAGHRLWLADLGRPEIVVPTARCREPVAAQAALVSLSAAGELRATAGTAQLAPLALADLPSFLSRVAAEPGAGPGTGDGPGTEGTEGVDAARALVLEIRPGGLALDGTEVSPATLLEGIAVARSDKPGAPVLVAPRPDSRFADLVAVLDRLRSAAARTLEVRYALPEPSLGTLAGPLLEDPSAAPEPARLALWIDRETRWSHAQGILGAVRASPVDEVLLLTRLEVPGEVGAETYPGGLPGGLALSLRPLRETIPGGAVSLMAAEDPLALMAGWEDPDRRRPDDGERSDKERSGFFSAGAPAPVLVGGDVQPPEKVASREPEYTEIARQARIQGVVILQLIIDSEGYVRTAKVLKGLPMGLSEKAVEAVLEWRFRPATLDGRPVAVFYNVTVLFRL